MADALVEYRQVTWIELSRATGANFRWKMHKNLSTLLVDGPLILHDIARSHIVYVLTKNTSLLWVGSVIVQDNLNVLDRTPSKPLPF